MKVLTVKQPWANLILAGHKNLENRSWGTKFRGRFLIHSSLQVDKFACEKYDRLGLTTGSFARGFILGSVELVDVLDLKNKSTMNSWWDGSAYGWILKDPKYIPPIQIKGKLKLWELDCNEKS